MDASAARALVDGLRAMWIEFGATLAPGASEAELDAFELERGVALPDVMRVLHASFDSVEHGPWVFRMWPLAKIADAHSFAGEHRGSPDYGPIRETLPDARDGFVIADAMILPHVVAVRLRPAPGAVIWICGDDWGELAPTIDAFWERYADDPWDLNRLIT